MTGVQPISVGDVLDDKYRIEQVLGEGAMGVVFAARHLTLNKRVAIKTLRTEIAQNAELVGRFEQEARAASAIGHPNIIEVFDLGSAPGGTRYMVMEHLAGQSLHELLQKRPLLTPQNAVAIAAQTLSALAAAHKRGIVHRDLKPENIFLARGEDQPDRVKLLDFGISKVLEAADPQIAGVDSAARATRMGEILGTPLYMSPEQARGQTDIDHRVDLWAVGCVLYEMLCGRTPFEGENYHQILVAILEGGFPAPRQLRPALPEPVEQVILRAMSAERDQRFGSAAEMREALIAGLRAGREPVAAAPVQPAAPPAAPAAAPPPGNLAQSQTGLAAAAAQALAGNDGAMLDALERLNVAAESGDGGVVTVDDSAARATPTPPAPDVAPAGSPPAAAGADLFAPPDSSEADLPLALEVAEPATASRPVRTVADRPGAAAPVRSSSAPSTARRSGGGVLGPAIKLALVLILLAAGGFAGYRYYTLGYLLSPPAPARIAVAIDLVPADAELTVDGAPVSERTVRVAADVPHQVQARAKGRMSAEQTLVVHRGDHPELVLHLPRLLATMMVPNAGSWRDAGDPADGEVEVGLTKLAGLERCLSALAPPLEATERQYLDATGGRAPSARHVPVVESLPAEVVSDCRLALGGAGDSEPPMASIDRIAPELLRAIDELGELTTRLEQYYRAREFEVDRFKLGKRSHAPLIDRFARARELQARLVDAVTATEAGHRARELEQIEQREGRSAHWHLRRVVLAARAWVWAEVRGAPAAARRAARAELTEASDRAAAQPAVDIAGLRGGREFLDAARQLLESASSATPPAPELVELLNRSIEAFNAMVL